MICKADSIIRMIRKIHDMIGMVGRERKEDRSRYYKGLRRNKVICACRSHIAIKSKLKIV